ncbi:MAG: hypothetical protein AB1861_08345 [Cyanobacteriota bacterium]
MSQEVLLISLNFHPASNNNLSGVILLAGQTRHVKNQSEVPMIKPLLIALNLAIPVDDFKLVVALCLACIISATFAYLVFFVIGDDNSL